MEKLVILDYITSEIHIYDIEVDIDVNEDFIKDLGFDPDGCSWMFGENIRVTLHGTLHKLDKPKYCCGNCGGTNIQIQAWINANTNEYVDDISEGECWCEDCQRHTTLRKAK